MNDGNAWAELLTALIAIGSLLYARSANKFAKEANRQADRANDLAKEANGLSAEANEFARRSAERVSFVVTPLPDKPSCVIRNSGSVTAMLDEISFREHRNTWDDQFGTFDLNPEESKERYVSKNEWEVKAGQQVTITFHRSKDDWHKRETWTGVVQEHPTA